MPLRRCPKCKLEKSYDDFSKHKGKKDGLRSWCKACEKEALQEWRSNPENAAAVRLKDAAWAKAHPEKRQAYQRRLTTTRKQYILAAKDKPCIDCGLHLPPSCMDLDHVRGVKEFGLHKGHAYSIKRIQAEIEKCDVRCPSCHRLRHYYERLSKKLSESN